MDKAGFSYHELATLPQGGGEFWTTGRSTLDGPWIKPESPKLFIAVSVSLDWSITAWCFGNVWNHGIV